MIKNYFKIAFRNLIRQKGYSAINIIGLAIGISCTILLTLWIVDELSYDQFHINGDRIYRVLEHQEYSSQSMEVAVTPGPLATALKEKFPEIKRAARFDNVSSTQLKFDNTIYPKFTGAYVDPEFLEMFSFPSLQGNTDPLKDINSIVITSKVAEQMFGSEDPIGKTILFGDKPMTVSAVLADIPVNSHLYFQYLLPMAYFATTDASLEEWGTNSLHTYIEINENIDFADLDAKIKNVIKENNEGASSDLYLQPLFNTHLHSVGLVADFDGMGDFRYVVIFGCISLFII
ncbi:MAG: ABC transporter permease, partial [Candidatus Electryonea clarkiae]|nr:ABC transporter permease [Candidatus Electryonea clarkiae]